MRLLQSLDDVQINEKTAVTVGKFDGLHVGHSLLLNRIVQLKSEGYLAAAVTFDRTPSETIRGKAIRLLMTREEKLALLRDAGLDLLVELPFDRKLMTLAPEAFIRLLCQRLHMGYMIVGDDFTYGYRGAGSIELLHKLAKDYGFTLDVIERIRDDVREVSSSYVREEIAAGHIAAANRLLGHPYYIMGEIVHGNGIGAKRLNRATINIIPSEEKLLPPNGVYITQVVLDGRTYHGVSDIGFRPTIIEETKRLGVETHILDYHGQAYEKMAKVVFLEYLRPEMKFDSLDALKRQIEQDIRTTYSYFNQNNR